MGIPKFFRWISERYPLTSQLIEENKIPEFDNFYLDFNGIIHNCSHPNDDDPHFRLSEEQIFTSIFSYVEHLFGKIKPKRLFFMAVDGVAPRAKMNQQRSRRFKTAKEAQELREKAEKKGEKLPEEKAFDSNCITPGTPFMARLSEQLKYFVNKKITEDANWRGVQVVLSGHEVPGEGEHKIMEYIRLSKAQPDYNPNTRHCLYGLDADLIMLGLLSHDPHFCLLREEVKFGPARKKSNTSLEHTNFFLLHLCLFREYLDLEFRALAQSLTFTYNLEHIIDDFILLAVFVGNDFLPHLPDFHIHDNALEKLFEIYKEVLPKAGGYLNESGVINTQRLQLILNALSTFEQQAYEKEHADMNWFKGKQRPKQLDAVDANRRHQPLTITQDQKDLFWQIKKFVLDARKRKREPNEDYKLSFVNDFSARDRTFLIKVAEELRLVLTWDEYDDDDNNLATLRLPVPPPTTGGSDDDDDDEADGGEAGRAAVDAILSKYTKAKTLEEQGTFDERYEVALKQRMDEWKRDYYREKMHIDFDNKEQLQRLVYRYVEGLQWVMHYYYSGVASWGWFYDYHYAPRITDLLEVDKMTFKFDLGKPFRPYEQLMGVLPEASKDHIPVAYRDLMYDPASPILDFYPKDFESDLNGKKQEWEAIVKIPFIDEKRLLHAMASREHRLTTEEKRRNSLGTSTTFQYTEEETVYPSSLPGFFPPIHRCQCKMKPFDLPTLDGLHLVKGLRDGVKLGIHAMAGFPSLETLNHTAQVVHHSVNVFQADSKNATVVLHIENPWEKVKPNEIAEKLVGNRIFVNWPFLLEGIVVGVSDSHFKYEKQRMGDAEKVVGNPLGGNGMSQFSRQAEKIETHYSKRFAVITGEVDVLVHVRPLKGLKRLDDGSLVKDYEGPDQEIDQAVQMCLLKVEAEDPRFQEQLPPPITQEFPPGTTVFFLGEHAYGTAAQVSSTTPTSLAVMLAFFPAEQAESTRFTQVVFSHAQDDYYPSYQVAQIVRVPGLAIAKITSSFMVVCSDGAKINLGLSLKFDAKGLKVLNYSRKEDKGWEFSAKAVELIQEYKNQYPDVFNSLGYRGDGMLKATDLYPNCDDADAKVKAVRQWLNGKGLRDLEPVALDTQTLEKETVLEIEALANSFNANKTAASIKKAIVQGIPRQAVLKPAHSVHRLSGQKFRLGDRVIMVQDSGSVPLCAKGVVIGLNEKGIDVVWDNPFIGGTTLNGRCSEYRGSTCSFTSCLNLTLRQFVQSTKPNAHPPQDSTPTGPIHSRTHSTPVAPTGPNLFHLGRGRGGHQNGNGPMRILANPHRGRGGSISGHSPGAPYTNGQAPHGYNENRQHVPRGGQPNSGSVINGHSNGHRGRGRARGAPVDAPTRESPPPPPSQHGSGRGSFTPRGRGYGHGSPYRGRGRGGGAPASTIVPS